MASKQLISGVLYTQDGLKMACAQVLAFQCVTGKTQEQLAKEWGLAPTSIGSLLNAAREEGVPANPPLPDTLVVIGSKINEKKPFALLEIATETKILASKNRRELAVSASCNLSR